MKIFFFFFVAFCLKRLAAHDRTRALARRRRARGWLRFLWRKATHAHGAGTGDDWSAEGPGPHEWWDKKTGAPVSSFPRMDIQQACYTLALMSMRTPAWREVYAEVLAGPPDR